MKYILKKICVISILIMEGSRIASAQQPQKRSDTPLDLVCQMAPMPGIKTSCPDVSNTLPDARTAYAVGMAILRARYGADFLKPYMPYEAYLSPGLEDMWCLSRKYPKGALVPRGGGHPEICLSKRDGRVIRIGLSA